MDRYSGIGVLVFILLSCQYFICYTFFELCGMRSVIKTRTYAACLQRKWDKDNKMDEIIDEYLKHKCDIVPALQAGIQKLW